MSELPVSTYLDLVVKSGLVDEGRLASIFPQTPDSVAEAVHTLIQQQFLTRWQHAMLCKGLWRGFFLGRYKLLKELGSGGMSSVYLAEHSLLRRPVAVKVLHQKRAVSRAHLVRFYRESRATAALDHPNIVRVHDFDIEGKFHFLVMELVDGPSLQKLVDDRGPLPVSRAVHFIAQAAAGLAHAHVKGLVHRDVKPANLLINRRDEVKLSDFGLTRILRDNETSLTADDGSVLGTVDFLSPEQAMNSHDVEPRADVYSLGCTLYFTLTGEPPFNSGTMAVRLLNHQTRSPEPLVKRRPDVPLSLAELCDSMLAKRVQDRPTAAEVYDRLTDWGAPKHVLAELPSILDHLGSEVRVDSSADDTLAAATGMASTLMTGSHVIAGHPDPGPVEANRTLNCPRCHTLLLVGAGIGPVVNCPECQARVPVPDLDAVQRQL